MTPGSEDGEATPYPATLHNTKYPRSVFFIFATEFCNVFTFFGLRAVLVMFLTTVLNYSDSEATIIFHSFTMLVFFMPLFGAFLADSILGKFKTIFYMSLIYVLGNAVFAGAALPYVGGWNRLLAIVAIVFVAVGNGGIKPCIFAFGADQFGSGQKRFIDGFFASFYFTFTFGGLLSILAMPLVRSGVQCFGQDTCYPLAFGLPTLVLLLSVGVFAMGYRLYTKVPPKWEKSNIASCILYALKTKRLSQGEGVKDHWLDYAEEKYGRELVGNIKQLLKLVVLYLPFPFFWALFEQQGSRWTLQAATMDGHVTSWLTILPDQMQMFNPLLVLGLIPVFQKVVYPWLAKCNLLKKPLQRMTVGMAFTALSFLVAAWLQIKIEAHLPELPSQGFTQVSVINGAGCDIQIHRFDDTLAWGTIRTNQRIQWRDIPEGVEQNVQFKTIDCGSALVNGSYSFVTDKNTRAVLHYIFMEEGKIQVLKMNYSLAKPVKESKVLFLNAMKVKGFDAGEKVGTYRAIKPGTYQVEGLGRVDIKDRGVYVIGALPSPRNSSEPILTTFTQVAPNVVNMGWQILQYVLLTVGEILFSVTGFNFSYTQAPKQWKSLLQAMWLLTITLGNFLVVVIEELSIFKKPSGEFFGFSAMLGVVAVVFAILAHRYKPVEADEPVEEAEYYTDITKYGENDTTQL